MTPDGHRDDECNVPGDVVDRAVAALVETSRATGVPSGLAERAIALRDIDPPADLASPAARDRGAARTVRFRPLAYGALSVVLLVMVAGLAVSYLVRPPAAFGDVVETIRRAASVSYTRRDGLGKTARVLEHHSVVRSEQGDGMVWVVDFATGRLVELNAQARTAVFGAVSRPMAPQVESLLMFFREKLDTRDGTAAGRATLDGRSTEKYTSVADGISLTMWVDPATRLPVKVEIDGPEWLPPKHRFTTTLEDFDWNPPIDPTALQVQVPAGYRQDPLGSVTMDVMTKDGLASALGRHAALTDFLRSYADASGGRFPEALGELVLDFQRDGESLKRRRPELEAGWRAMLDFRSALEFADRPLHYLGRGRRLRDGQGILAWWPAENDGYVAVFDDLSIREVAVSDLPGGRE